MDGDRHERTIEVFNDALEVDTDERTAFLVTACAGDARLLREVRSLLDAEKNVPPAGLLAPFNGRDEADERSAEPPDALVGERVGAYTVLGVLGEGGMGVVYRAEQASPQRTVALKVIQPGRLGRSARRRFEYEAEVLGRLHHPGIAQVYEAGTADTPHGPRPFFAMELIEGRPLIAYANEEGLDSRARLALMAKVCDAVDHAHQHGVIHRDLKPANILVDAEDRPKVLDFGVARAVDSDIAITTMRTSVGELIGTLHYMSPEQCDGDPRRLDTRSDIYALGIVCWELLAGELPYDIKGKPLPEAIRIIREQEPRTLGSMTGILRGDVETIVSKAIEKEREQRYQSASSLASDIRRFLRDEPIVARPPSTLYQLGRFAKRNRGLVTAVLALFVVLTAGVAGTTWEAIRAHRALRAATYFMGSRQSNSRHLEAVLIAALRSEPADPARCADIAAAMRRAGLIGSVGSVNEFIGDAYARLGRYDLAERHLWYSVHGNEDDPSTGTFHAVRAAQIMAELLRQAGRLGEAETLLLEVFDRLGEIPTAGANHPANLETTRTLRMLGTRQLLADVRRDQGALTEADSMLREILTIVPGVLASPNARPKQVVEIKPDRDEPQIVMTKRSLAAVAIARSDHREAERILRQLIDADEEESGRDWFVHWIMEYQLGLALVEQGRLEEAEPMLERVTAGLSDVYGAEAMEALRATTSLARLRLAQDRVDDAETLLASVVDAAGRVYPDHWQTAVFRGELGLALARQGRHAQAEAALTHARDDLTALFGPDDYRLARLRVSDARE